MRAASRRGGYGGGATTTRGARLGWPQHDAALRDLYGDPAKDAADAVFVYEYMRNAANAEQVPS